MKNKKNTYLLLFVVLLIWGMVIYRFFSYSGPETTDIQNTNNFAVKQITAKVRDTVSLNVNYRDPFLGKMYMPEGSKKTGVKRKTTTVEKVMWPQVVYKGIVSDTGNKKKVYMLLINGRIYLMKEKDTEQDITLKSGDRHSVTVKFMGELTTIMIKE